MAIESAPYYFAVCDNCGELADYDEYSAFRDPGQAGDEAIAAGWTDKDGKWHCRQCPPLDEDEGETSG